MDRVKDYLGRVVDLLVNAPSEDVKNVGDLIMDAYQKGTQVFVLGNGGSASTASHFACDLQKGVGLAGKKKFKVMALTDSIPLMTAWANDYGYSRIFAEQLATWVQPGDLVIAISGSGNSPNVISAMEVANEKGAVTVGMSGYAGGKLAQIAKHNIVVTSEDMQHIEDVHVVFTHLLFRYVLDQLMEAQKA